MSSETDRTQRYDRVVRMFRQGQQRLAAASILAQHPTHEGDSDYLLNLLGFEILLKALHLAHLGTIPRDHDYYELFNALPEEARDTLRQVAHQCLDESDSTDLEELMTTFSKNFIRLRYSYEPYEEMPEVEYREKAEQWLEDCTPVEDATYVYYPETLHSLTAEISSLLEEWLAKPTG